MDKRLLRLVFVFEFLVALIAVYTLWSQVAGQGHLDIMPWFWKLGLGVALSYAIVKATAAAVSQERAWSLATLKWFVLIVVLGAGCGLVTYYYHLYNEPEAEEEEEEPAVTATTSTARSARPPSASPGFR